MPPMDGDLPLAMTPDRLEEAAKMAGPLHIFEGGTYQDAENAVFHAVTELWKYEKKNPESVRHPKAWMWTVARRHLRHNLEKVRAELVTDQLPDQVDQEEVRPEEVLARKEATRRAHGLVTQLPAGERAAVFLRHFAEMDTCEIAKALHIGEEAVRARLSRGHRTLKKSLNEGGASL
ncbi:RNA polymerase sigma factor (sigma-70 family) [Lipingzhangella halophila]|uniref:RNA polymerase sigma factor (Sigma-70 family) n=1 Tax=Lipingzhangella halophila TaxID=1783352 RepID=A0A7W7RGB7_9ACTN|nr:sigma-70 family RNA polymerase sigma factor [Lipingzhangella halophila]MBB4931370.1 RNA polymerase sigma factor (sigma-70 family) [Lipingzhangella halophila]